VCRLGVSGTSCAFNARLYFFNVSGPGAIGAGVRSAAAIWGSGCELAVTTVVARIAPEDDDCNRAGNAPVRATVRSKPF
jgi:hypothetical protein